MTIGNSSTHRCAICLENLPAVSSPCPELKCEHEFDFHQACLVTWIRNCTDKPANCPICRDPVVEKKEMQKAKAQPSMSFFNRFEGPDNFKFDF